MTMIPSLEKYAEEAGDKEESAGVSVGECEDRLDEEERQAEFEELLKLESLPAKAVASFPSECDRKRTVGCLAAVLSMMYDYESLPAAAPAAYSRDTAAEASFYDEDDTADGVASSTAKTNRKTNRNLFGMRRKPASTRPPSASPPPQQSTQRQQRSRQYQSALLSHKRHLRRRHLLYCNLLESSATLLSLEASIAQAFLPMLARLLDPLTEGLLLGVGSPRTAPSPSDSCRPATQKRSVFRNRTDPKPTDIVVDVHHNTLHGDLQHCDSIPRSHPRTPDIPNSDAEFGKIVIKDDGSWDFDVENYDEHSTRDLRTHKNDRTSTDDTKHHLMPTSVGSPFLRHDEQTTRDLCIHKNDQLSTDDTTQHLMPTSVDPPPSSHFDLDLLNKPLGQSDATVDHPLLLKSPSVGSFSSPVSANKSVADLDEEGDINNTADNDYSYHDDSCASSLSNSGSCFFVAVSSDVYNDPVVYAHTDDCAYNRAHCGEPFKHLDGSVMQTLPRQERLHQPTWDNNELLKPFLDSLTPGAGLQCLSLLILHHLLRGGEGYDARIRHVFKKLGVVILMHEMKTHGMWLDRHIDHLGEVSHSERGNDYSNHQPTASTNQPFSLDDFLAECATRKFEALEHGIAGKIITLSEAHRRQQQKNQRDYTDTNHHNAHTNSPDAVAASSHRDELSFRNLQQQTEHSNTEAICGTHPGNPNDLESSRCVQPYVTRAQLLRGLKIGSVGIVAGTLFALTGGLAAPGIAAGLAALGATTASTAAVMGTLTSTAAVTAIFGVGGGGLAAYKTHRRTQGVTEFEFQKELSPVRRNCHSSLRHRTQHRYREPLEKRAELFSTVCISGWLRDIRDFQRPWGVTPTKPPITDKLEKLERFYSIYKPENVPRCARILQIWKGEERQLWKTLRQKYGQDPDTLFPLEDGPRLRAHLTHEENEVIEKLLEELGYSVPAAPKDEENHRNGSAYSIPIGKMTDLLRHRLEQRRLHREENTDSMVAGHMEGEATTAAHSRPILIAMDSLHGHTESVNTNSTPQVNERFSLSTPSGDAASKAIAKETHSSNRNYASLSTASNGVSSPSIKQSSEFDSCSQPQPQHTPAQSPDSATVDLALQEKKPLVIAWDYHAEFGGELYTVRWESALLMELCDSVTDMAVDWVGNAASVLLKQTALATLMTAIAWPYALVSAANMIDGTWTLAIERADAAGIELAKSLLESRAGHRPVTLAGFSMGARTIYSCLKELARHQDIWEEQQEQLLEELRREAEGGFSDCANYSRGKGGRRRDNEFMEYTREPASIVEDAILMGTPNHLSLTSWAACRRIVAGRLVNCYSRKDWILALMFQYKRLALKPVCGTNPVHVLGVENYDVTDLISAHSDYCLMAGDILRRVRHGQPHRESFATFNRVGHNTEEVIGSYRNEKHCNKQEMDTNALRGSTCKKNTTQPQLLEPLSNELTISKSLK